MCACEEGLEVILVGDVSGFLLEEPSCQPPVIRNSPENFHPVRAT